MIQHFQLSGFLQVGQGTVNPLHSACVQAEGTGFAVLLSADGRIVWLTLDRQSARTLGQQLLSATADKPALVQEV